MTILQKLKLIEARVNKILLKMAELEKENKELRKALAEAENDIEGLS